MIWKLNAKVHVKPFTLLMHHLHENIVSYNIIYVEIECQIIRIEFYLMWFSKHLFTTKLCKYFAEHNVQCKLKEYWNKQEQL